MEVEGVVEGAGVEGAGWLGWGVGWDGVGVGWVEGWGVET